MKQWDGEHDVLVAAFEKNGHEQVYVRLRAYEGHPLIDVRIWYQDKQTEEWKPSPKGISISVDHYEELRAAIERIDEFL